MSKKVIPFIKPGKQSVAGGSPVALESLGPKKSDDGKIVDHGTLGKLSYEVYDRNVIHIFDKDGLRFKKDIYIFEDVIKSYDFERMLDGSEHLIQGSGNNDHLLFTKANGDIQITLKHREFEALGLLKSIITKGQRMLKGGN